MTADGWDGVHLGEATAHAWLDGALPPDEAARAQAHVATCPDCTALVAEARGLIAGASRILGALDAVPAGVVPAPAPVLAPTIRPPAARRWWTGAPARAAAAVLLLAGGSAVVLRDRGVKERSAPAAQSVEMTESRAVADATTDSAAPAAEPAAAPTVAPTPSIAAAPGPARRKAAPTRAADVAPAPPSPVAALASAPPAEPPMAPAPVPAPAVPAAVGESRRELAPAAAKAMAADAMVAGRRVDTSFARAQSLVGNATGVAGGVARGVAPGAGLITGRVVTPEGRPLAGAQVQVMGTNAGATTDSTGAFRVRSPLRGPAMLRALRVGYQVDTARVFTRGEDTVSATLVMKPATITPGVTALMVNGDPSAADLRDAARAAGCWTVRAERGWTAAAPALPAVLRLERADRAVLWGDASVVDETERAAWRDGYWSVQGGGTISVRLPATGGEAVYTLRRASRDWRGTAMWTATPPATRDVAPADVRLVATRCPAR